MRCLTCPQRAAGAPPGVSHWRLVLGEPAVTANRTIAPIAISAMPAPVPSPAGCLRAGPAVRSSVRPPAEPPATAATAAAPCGDQMVGQQQDSRPGDGGDPGGQIEESLQGVVVKVEQLGGRPAAQQRAGDADQA